MVDPGLAVQTVVGFVAISLVGIFVKHWRDMIVKIIPDGFKLIRDEMRVAERAAMARHKEHIAHMEKIEASLARQDDEKRRRSAARAKEPREKPPRSSKPPKKPR